MKQVVNKVTSENKVVVFEKQSDLTMETRAPRDCKTQAGDMQKLYLTAHAQCHGATTNVNPQKYDPLRSSRTRVFTPFS